MKEEFKRQVALLLDVLPEVAKEESFALHGGTAINLFVRGMPRLSVDIDLTFVQIDERNRSFEAINAALSDIGKRLEKVSPEVKVQLQKEQLKLLVDHRGGKIKLEVNQINRGCIAEPVELMLCKKAQEMFDVFVSMKVVPESQLFGGKIVAALDRQHPRDLFDVKPLVQGGELPAGMIKGLVFCLLSSSRPITELLDPHMIDQRQVLQHQFEGMSSESFAYEEFETTRKNLIRWVRELLSPQDKDFILSFKKLEPDWSIYNFERFPAIQWKLENLLRFRQENNSEYLQAVDRLDTFFNSL